MKKGLFVTLIFIVSFSITVFGINENEKIKNYVTIKKLPHEYDISTATTNGDTIRSISGVFNLVNLDDFMKYYNRSKFDYIRITSYTVEGQPIIQEIVYQDGKLRLTIDTTRDDFGLKSIKSYTVNKLAKTEVEANGNSWIEYRAYLNEKRFITIFFIEC